MHRRQFCRSTLAASAALSYPFLQACERSRRAGTMVIAGFWDNPAEDDTVIEATRTWFRALEPHTGGYYSNIDYKRPNAEAGSYGPAYRRLQKVKAQYGPAQSVPAQQQRAARCLSGPTM